MFHSKSPTRLAGYAVLHRPEGRLAPFAASSPDTSGGCATRRRFPPRTAPSGRAMVHQMSIWVMSVWARLLSSTVSAQCADWQRYEIPAQRRCRFLSTAADIGGALRCLADEVKCLTSGHKRVSAAAKQTPGDNVLAPHLHMDEQTPAPSHVTVYLIVPPGEKKKL